MVAPFLLTLPVSRGLRSSEDTGWKMRLGYRLRLWGVLAALLSDTSCGIPALEAHCRGGGFGDSVGIDGEQIAPASSGGACLWPPDPSSSGEEKVFRRAPSWRKRFRPRDHHSGGMLGTSAETLPAGFRVSTLGPLQPPPAPPKKIMPEAHSHYLYGHMLSAFRD